MSTTPIHLPQLRDESPLRQAWRQCAVGVAAVAGGFSLIVTAALLIAIVRDTRENPLAATQLADLQARAKTASPKEIQTLRSEDQRIRLDYFRRRQFLKHGGWLLLAGIVVLAGAVKSYYKLAAPPPAPLAGDRPSSNIGRWSILAGGVVMAATLIAIAGSYSRPLNFSYAPPEEGAASKPKEAGSITDEAYQRNWTMFRGYGGLAVAPAGDWPREWNGPGNKNILWKSPVPLAGHNSPIVWDNRLFISGGDETRGEVYCYDAADGKLLWTVASQPEKALTTEVLEALKKFTGFAPSTMATDGRHVFAIFPGGNLLALNFDGQVVWKQELGPVQQQLRPRGLACGVAQHADHPTRSGADPGQEVGADRARRRHRPATLENSAPVGQSWSTPIIIPAGKGADRHLRHTFDDRLRCA